MYQLHTHIHIICIQCIVYSAIEEWMIYIYTHILVHLPHRMQQESKHFRFVAFGGYDEVWVMPAHKGPSEKPLTPNKLRHQMDILFMGTSYPCISQYFWDKVREMTQWNIWNNTRLKRGCKKNICWVVPPPSNSHHQDYYIFSRGSQPKPSFATGILGGGTTQNIWQKTLNFNLAQLAQFKVGDFPRGSCWPPTCRWKTIRQTSLTDYGDQSHHHIVKTFGPSTPIDARKTASTLTPW